MTLIIAGSYRSTCDGGSTIGCSHVSIEGSNTALDQTTTHGGICGNGGFNKICEICWLKPANRARMNGIREKCSLSCRWCSRRSCPDSGSPGCSLPDYKHAEHKHRCPTDLALLPSRRQNAKCNSIDIEREYRQQSGGLPRR